MNEAGYSSGNSLIPALGDLPLLQDDATANVWSSWGATWRDVYIVDGDNQLVEVYSLTTYNLSDPTNYATLKSKFIAAGEAL